MHHFITNKINKCSNAWKTHSHRQLKKSLLGYIQISIAMLVVKFEFCKVVLLVSSEGFTLNPTDEGYPGMRSMQLLLIAARV